MSLNLRLVTLKLRQKLNFRLVRLLAVAAYILLTASFVLYNMSGGGGGVAGNGVAEYQVEDTESADSVKDRFHAVGGLQQDFRKEGAHASADLPSSVRDFESLVEEGKGENGAGVHLSGLEREKAEELQKKWAFNKIVSDKISLWRSLSDMRSGQCKALNYVHSSLPSSSVVIIFNNEALSALLRTVWSVLDRTPAQILHEVVLVDDGSNHTDIVDTLPLYIRHRLPPTVRLVRNPSQLGLIRARVEGARASTGDIVVFLDSHCEASKGWLEPMAKRIQEDPTVVQIPRIDMIDATSLSYFGGGGGGSVSVGGFTWSGHFTWEGLPREVEKTRKHTDPAKTATMAGGLFAIQRDFFWRIGGYDEGMFGWGGENLELSFRVWRCGGSMEIHPCSHVGHIFRPFHPYHIPEDSHGINTARMAEVWMDEYKRFFYMHRADLRGKDVGDLTERHAIKDRLGCKSFKWFLDTVYPHKFIMDEQSIAWGRMRAADGAKQVCIDHLQRDMAHKLTSYDLGEYPCHPFLGSSQYYVVSKIGEFRNEYMCGQVSSGRSEHDSSGPVKIQMVACNDKNLNQRWTLSPGGELRHNNTGLCLDMGAGSPGQEVSVEKCDGSARQVWRFDFYEAGKESWRPNVAAD